MTILRAKTNARFACLTKQLETNNKRESKQTQLTHMLNLHLTTAIHRKQHLNPKTQRTEILQFCIHKTNSKLIIVSYSNGI